MKCAKCGAQIGAKYEARLMIDAGDLGVIQGFAFDSAACAVGFVQENIDLISGTAITDAELEAGPPPASPDAEQEAGPEASSETPQSVPGQPGPDESGDSE